MEKAYVGVTGITTKDEVAKVGEAFKDNCFNLEYSEHVPMMGFLLSKRADGRVRNPTDRRHIELGDLSSLLETAKGRAFNTIHYNTDSKTELYSEVRKVLEYDKIYDRSLVGGVQFNVVWPLPEELRTLRQA